MAEPKVRFKQDNGETFPEWCDVRFGDVFTEVIRKTSDTKTYPLFSLTIEKGVTAKTDRYERSFLVKKDEDNYKIVPPNAFVYNPMNLRFGALAPSHEDKEVSVSQYYNVFTLNDERTLAFWENYLVTDAMLQYYFSIATGSLIEKLRVHYSAFVNIVKQIPCIEEQCKIADFLSSIDEVISTSEEEIENLEKQKKAVMKKVFSQEVRFKKADGSDFSVWEEKKVSELGSIIGGGTPKTSVEEYWNGDIPWISSADLEENNIHSVHMTRFITDEAIDSSATKRVPEGAILIITRVGVGKVAIAPCDLCTSQDYMSVVSEDGDRTFMGYALSKLMQDKVANVQGTSIKGIPSDEIREYKVGIPCLEEQRLIADFLSDFDEAIAAAKKELELWKELKKGLLQQMFV